jgi:hypothetical protein
LAIFTWQPMASMVIIWPLTSSHFSIRSWLWYFWDRFNWFHTSIIQKGCREGGNRLRQSEFQFGLLRIICGWHKKWTLPCDDMSLRPLCSLCLKPLAPPSTPSS